MFSIFNKKHPNFSLKTWHWLGCLFGAIAFFLWWLLADHPQWVESFYSLTWYPKLAGFLTGFSFWSPISLHELIIVGLIITALVILISGIFAVIASRNNPKWLSINIVKTLFAEAALAGWVVFIFSVVWGFNYLRQPTENIFELTEMSDQLKRQVMVEGVKQTNGLRQQITENLCSQNANFREQDHSVERVLDQFLTFHELPVINSANSKTFIISDLMKRLGIAGIYNPFVAQPGVTSFQHPIIRPHTIAHERAHLNGFADEDSANLVAYVALWRYGSVEEQYSAWLQFWIATGVQGVRHTDTENAAVEKLSEQVLNDWQCIREYNRQWARLHISKPMWKTYDKYLKATGSKQGIASYRKGEELALQYLSKLPNK